MSWSVVMGQAKIPLGSTRYVPTRHVRRVERVETSALSLSTSSWRACRAVLFDELDTAKMRGLDTSNVLCVETWPYANQMEFGLYAPPSYSTLNDDVDDTRCVVAVQISGRVVNPRGAEWERRWWSMRLRHADRCVRIVREQRFLPRDHQRRVFVGRRALSKRRGWPTPVDSRGLSVWKQYRVAPKEVSNCSITSPDAVKKLCTFYTFTWTAYRGWRIKTMKHFKLIYTQVLKYERFPSPRHEHRTVSQPKWSHQIPCKLKTHLFLASFP